MSTRQEKVEELLRAEISEIIQREIKDPRLGLVSVTEVEITPDLQHAKVFISALGDEEQRKEGLKTLRHASGFIRGELGKRIRMRVIPELDFRIDTSIEQGARIFELLQKIKKDESEE